MPSYYPYLRGKQFELRALRELTKLLPDYTNVCPIIEPLNDDQAAIRAAMADMLGCGMPFALILNPYRGDFVADKGAFAKDAIDYINSLVSAKWMPAFCIDQNIDFVKTALLTYSLKKVMLVSQEGVDFDDLKDLLDSGKVEYIVSPESRTLFRKIKFKYKKIKIIRLDDNFPAVKKNNDYRDTDDSKNEDQAFSEEHIYFKGDDYAGFSDYTLINKELSDGGALPYVVAIHLTYFGKDDEFRVRHFLSDSNVNGRENIQKKFAEAAIKVEDFFAKRVKDKTSAVSAIVNYMKEGHYPGLGSLKKLSILHHILLVDKYLREMVSK
jgi:hypothetical protein